MHGHGHRHARTHAHTHTQCLFPVKSLHHSENYMHDTHRMNYKFTNCGIKMHQSGRHQTLWVAFLQPVLALAQF